MNKVTVALLVGAMGIAASMMAQASNPMISGPCDDGYKVFELDVCVPNDMDYGEDYKKAIGIIKTNMRDQHGLTDFLHVEKLIQLPGNGNFASTIHTKQKNIKIFMYHWKVEEALISDR